MRAQEITGLADRLRVRFAPEPALLNELVQVVEQEQAYCSFLRFHILVEARGGPILLDVTGPPGTAQMLRTLSTSLASHDLQ